MLPSGCLVCYFFFGGLLKFFLGVKVFYSCCCFLVFVLWFVGDGEVCILVWWGFMGLFDCLLKIIFWKGVVIGRY